MARFYQFDSDPFQEERYGAIKYPAQAKPRSFLESFYAGEYGKGYGSAAEAAMHLKRATVICPADDGKYYVVSRWMAKLYYRYIDGLDK